MNTQKPPTGPSGIPTKKQFIGFAVDHEFDAGLAVRTFRYYQERDWRFGNGDPLTPELWIRVLNKFEREENERRAESYDEQRDSDG